MKEIPTIGPEIAQPFQVYGIEVRLMTPVFIRIDVPVSWSRLHFPTFLEQAQVQDRVEKAIRYMVEENLIAGDGTGAAVFMKHLSD